MTRDKKSTCDCNGATMADATHRVQYEYDSQLKPTKNPVS